MTDKFVLVSDVHLSIDTPRARLDDVRVTGFKKFQYILEWAAKNNAIILQAGDLGTGPRNWQLLAGLMDLFEEDDELYCVYGQHDTYLYSEETRDATMMGALIGAKKIQGLNAFPRTFQFRTDICYVYGCNYGQDIPKPLPVKEVGYNILVIHAPIAEKALFDGQKYMDAERFLDVHRDYKIILCGDIHQKFKIEKKGRYIINAGPMIRREATEYNFHHKPGFWVWDVDEETMTWQGIPYQPASEVLTRDHIELEEYRSEILDEFINSVKTDMVDDKVSFMTNLWAFIRDNSIDEKVVKVIAQIVEEKE